MPDQKVISPQEAINILDQATAQIHATREDHITIANAINALRVLHPNDNVAPDKDGEQDQAK